MAILSSRPTLAPCSRQPPYPRQQNHQHLPASGTRDNAARERYAFIEPARAMPLTMQPQTISRAVTDRTPNHRHASGIETGSRAASPRPPKPEGPVHWLRIGRMTDQRPPRFTDRRKTRTQSQRDHQEGQRAPRRTDRTVLPAQRHL